MCSTESIGSKSPLMTLPNELFLQVASHLKGFKDLNSLVRTSGFFHGMFNYELYRRAVTADDVVLDEVVRWVLSEYRLAPLTLLLDHGLSFNYTGKFGIGFEGTMLRFLCRLDDQERSVPLARLLVQRGADIEVKDSTTSHGGTVLHSAIKHGKGELVELLLAHGADPNGANSWGLTPLHVASKRNEARIVELLIAHGAFIDRHDGTGYTALFFAFRWDARDVIPVLLAHGADRGAKITDGGWTLLHYASNFWTGDYNGLAKSLLVLAGADVNAIDASGKTPLHFAARGIAEDNGLFMAKFLLENGADVDAICRDGRSPLQEAISRDNDRVAALLLAHGADVSHLTRSERKRANGIVLPAESA
jgi:ankyrin repeat protein